MEPVQQQPFVCHGLPKLAAVAVGEAVRTVEAAGGDAAERHLRSVHATGGDGHRAVGVAVVVAAEQAQPLGAVRDQQIEQSFERLGIALPVVAAQAVREIGMGAAEERRHRRRQHEKARPAGLLRMRQPRCEGVELLRRHDGRVGPVDAAAVVALVARVAHEGGEAARREGVPLLVGPVSAGRAGYRGRHCPAGRPGGELVAPHRHARRGPFVRVALARDLAVVVAELVVVGGHVERDAPHRRALRVGRPGFPVGLEEALPRAVDAARGGQRVGVDLVADEQHVVRRPLPGGRGVPAVGSGQAGLDGCVAAQPGHRGVGAFPVGQQRCLPAGGEDE